MSQNSFYFSPLEQFTVTSFSEKIVSVFNDSLPLTNLGFYCILTVILVLGFHILGNNNNSLVANRWSLAVESSYITVSGIARDQIGTRNEIYTPFIVGLFWFILIANLNGNIPYGFTIITSAVSALSLSVTIFLGVTVLGLYLHKIHFFSFFVPSGTPLPLVPLLTIIELISYSARAVSLAVRIFSNLVAGHTLLKILSTFLYKLFASSFIIAIVTLIPYTIFLALIGLEIAVSLIQSYVFVVLVSSYLKDAIELH